MPEIEGTITFLRSNPPSSCVCCKDGKERGHVFCRYLAVDYPEGIGRWVEDQIMTLQEGTRVRITITEADHNAGQLMAEGRVKELEAENDELRAVLKRETNEYIEASHSLAIERDAFKSARDRLREQVNATIELLECAKINVDNIKKGGVIFCELTKMQIDEAIMELSQALAGKESMMKKEATHEST